MLFIEMRELVEQVKALFWLCGIHSDYQAFIWREGLNTQVQDSGVVSLAGCTASAAFNMEWTWEAMGRDETPRKV